MGASLRRRRLLAFDVLAELTGSAPWCPSRSTDKLWPPSFYGCQHHNEFLAVRLKLSELLGGILVAAGERGDLRFRQHPPQCIEPCRRR